MPLRSTLKVLCRQIRGHNLSVLAASGATLTFSVLGWAILYAAAYWFTMFGLTVAFAGAAQLPVQFHAICSSVFAVLILLAALDAWFFPHERVLDERPALSTLGDIILFLPRLTIATLLNFTAWASLSRANRSEAAVLLDRLRTERRISLSHLPLDLPDDRQRDRILRVLQLVQLTEIKSERGQLWLRLSPLAPQALRGKLVPEHTHDDLARVRRVTVFENKNALPCPKRQLPGRDRHDL